MRYGMLKKFQTLCIFTGKGGEFCIALPGFHVVRTFGRHSPYGVRRTIVVISIFLVLNEPVLCSFVNCICSLVEYLSLLHHHHHLLLKLGCFLVYYCQRFIYTWNVFLPSMLHIFSSSLWITFNFINYLLKSKDF